MSNGFCIAGIPLGSSRWVRPVKQSGQISQHDLVDSNGQPVAPLDLVSYDVAVRRGDPPHIEDCEVDLTARVTIEERPNEVTRQSLLKSLCEVSPDEVVKEKSRSLVLVEPDEINFVSFDPDNYGKYDVRLGFKIGDTDYQGESKAPGYKCTDLKLRNWGRKFHSRTVLNDHQLRSELGADDIFLVMGLARWFKGEYWPMVVGIHTCPDYSGVIDLSNP